MISSSCMRRNLSYFRSTLVEIDTHFARILKRNKNPRLILSFAGFFPLSSLFNHDGGGDHGDPRGGGGHVSSCPAASYRCR